MAEAAVPQAGTRAEGSARGLTWVIAWRNLWRNRRRTWLTVGGISFACFLVAATMSIQHGSYGSMIDTSTGFFGGQAEIVHPLYPVESKLEQTVTHATELTRALNDLPGIRAAARAQAFALTSVGERSFGGMIVGVDFAAERDMFTFYQGLGEGSLPVASDEVVIGRVMARNLGATVGDEVVMLGSAKAGGVGALALKVSGIFDSGQNELDRTLMFSHLDTVREGFALGDEAHAILLLGENTASLTERLGEIQQQLPDDVLLRDWTQIYPDVQQGIELDRIGGMFMFAAILVLASFSVINTFVMIVFERTREFGMLVALGMRPVQIMLQVQAEAFCMWLVGIAIGMTLTVSIVTIVGEVGIPVADFQDMTGAFMLPDRLHPRVALQSLVLAPIVLLVGTQLGALLATLRLRRLRPVEALRAQ